MLNMLKSGPISRPKSPKPTDVLTYSSTPSTSLKPASCLEILPTKPSSPLLISESRMNGSSIKIWKNV